ncbi:MAG: glycosyltransferase family 2 protein, partial [Candidatus Moranbacteria bacterium]|nr:glycosyltransferase family 2 protein [Candidatus Moranbacteria bacterium]
MEKPKVFTIIVNHNGGQDVLDAIKSVFQSSYTNGEIIVVDNDSTDGSFEKIRNQFPRIHAIKNTKNDGFGKGANLGIRFALEKMADFVFLLNPDATIEKDTIKKMVKKMERNDDLGIASPTIIDEKTNNIWFGGGKILWTKMRAIHTLEKYDGTKNVVKTEYVCGCAMFIRKEVFKKTGLFDERFFLYYEDADLSLSAKKNGWHLGVFPTIKIRHKERSNENIKNKTYWLVKSGLLFFEKHTPKRLKSASKIVLLARKCKNLLRRRKENDPLAHIV